MRRASDSSPDPDVDAQLRAAFVADDPEAAWYFDRVAIRVVRVFNGATNIPDLPADDVEDDEDRYAEIPALTESETHGWMEVFVEQHPDAKVAPLLDERQGSNARFLTKLAAASPAAFADWTALRAARLAETVAAWRAGLTA